MPAPTAPNDLGTLAYHRDRAGLTQQQAAAALGTTQATISRWEAGSRPRSRKMHRIADVYHISLDELEQAIDRTASLCGYQRKEVVRGKALWPAEPHPCYPRFLAFAS